LLALTATAYPHWLGGDYAFWRVNADAREVLGLGDGHLLALHALLQRSSARVPYYMMGQLGGPDLLRGYYRGRYQDRALGALEVEYRTPFVWRLGAAVFGGVGRVSEDLTGLRLDQLHPSMGAGVRLNVARAERLNLRADAGVGSDGPALYVGVGEAF
jgi:hemolysin activation/secretion protein